MKTTLSQPPLSGYERLREYLGFTYSFRFSTFKKFPELIPMVGIVGFVLTIGVAQIYHLTQAPDVRFVRSRGPAHEDIGPTHKFKYRIHNPDLYRPIAELEEVKDAVKVGPTPKK